VLEKFWRVHSGSHTHAHWSWKDTSAVLIWFHWCKYFHLFPFPVEGTFYGCFPTQSFVYFDVVALIVVSLVQFVLLAYSFWCIRRYTADLLVKCSSLLSLMKRCCRIKKCSIMWMNGLVHLPSDFAQSFSQTFSVSVTILCKNITSSSVRIT